jgi:hypothetical protein
MVRFGLLRAACLLVALAHRVRPLGIVVVGVGATVARTRSAAAVKACPRRRSRSAVRSRAVLGRTMVVHTELRDADEQLVALIVQTHPVLPGH